MKMLRIYACSVCKSAWLVGGEDRETQSLLGTMPSIREFACITPLCRGSMSVCKFPPQGFDVKEVPLDVFYRCINGLGSPDGKAAELERFRELLLSRKVIDIRAERVGQPERVILKTILLEGGARLHFDSSALGACCYYIEESPKTFVEAFDEHSDSADQGTSLGTDAGGEEARRDAEATGESGKGEQQGDPPNAQPDEYHQPGDVSAVLAGDDVPASGHPIQPERRDPSNGDGPGS